MIKDVKIEELLRHYFSDASSDTIETVSIALTWYLNGKLTEAYFAR